MKVEIYSDVACPWCYIGKRRFERALAAYPGAEQVEVVYRPFQLDPQAPAEGEPMRDYLARRFGAGAAGMIDRVVETARAEGLTMDYDRGLAANTLDALSLLVLAEREHGPEMQHALKEKLLEGHFAEGRDISDREYLAEAAEAVGLDGARVRAYLASEEARREVREQITGAQRIGVSAVPTFVFEGKYAVQGAQPASTFLQVLEQVQQEAMAGAATDGGDACADGSCSV